MKVYRRKFGRVIYRLFGGTQAGVIGFAGTDGYDRSGIIAWAVIFVIVVVVSLAVGHWLPLFAAEMCLAAIWGVFIGLTLLFFWPAPLLITTVGGWIGIGGADLAGAASVIEKISTAIHKITTALSTATETTMFVAPGWVFAFLVMVCCLPAYGSAGGSGGASPSTGDRGGGNSTTRGGAA